MLRMIILMFLGSVIFSAIGIVMETVLCITQFWAYGIVFFFWGFIYATIAEQWLSDIKTSDNHDR